MSDKKSIEKEIDTLKRVNKFLVKVSEFADRYCPEDMQEYDVDVDLTDLTNPRAKIITRDYYGHQWTIPVYINNDDEMVITFDGDDFFRLNGEGYYRYLWHDARGW